MKKGEHLRYQRLTSLSVALLLFAAIRPFYANTVRAQQSPSIQPSAVTEVGTTIVDEHTHIYYVDGTTEERIVITEGGQNSTDPHTDGEFIVYSTSVNGAGQIVRYHIPTASEIQITQASTNLHPRVNQGRVVWERWVDNSWHIYLYEAGQVKRLTSEGVATNPDISTGEVVFAQKKAGGWRALAFSLQARTLRELRTGLTAKQLAVLNDTISFGSVQRGKNKHVPRANSTYKPIVSEPIPTEEEEIIEEPEEVTEEEVRDELAEIVPEEVEVAEPVIEEEEVVGETPVTPTDEQIETTESAAPTE